MEQARISSAGSAQSPLATRSSRQAGDAAAVEGAPGGFLALLAALDVTRASDIAVAGDATGGAPDTDGGLLALATESEAGVPDASALAAWQGLAPPADGMSGQPLVASGRLGLEGAGASRWSGALIGGDGQLQGLVAETAQLDSAADSRDSAMLGPVAGYGRILSRMQNTLVQRGTTPGSAPTDAAADRASGVSSAHWGASNHQITATSVPGATTGNGAALVATVQGVGASVDRPATAMLGVQSPLEAASPAMAGALALTPAHDGSTAAGGRSAEGGAGAGAGWSGGEFSPTREADGVDTAALFGDPAQAAAEELVSDQVTYWVNQKTQNAELTLLREGQPVEVSVTLSGSEAHVTFRSDQAETRELLDRSMAQLSDLLRSEGLVLSGMSVGTATRDGAGAREAGQHRQREGARQTQVVSATPSAGNAVRAAGGVSRDGAVDIFV